jgi:pimeloyl-ACP methyl ester carboxylesterase
VRNGACWPCEDRPVQLRQAFEWRGRQVRWDSWGEGAPVVFCHGTPWSSALWRPFADALSNQFRVYLWDMPGYGESSMEAEQRVSLDVQGELLADLIGRWDLERPHMVAHDYGGAVALRAHLLHGARYRSLALVDVVALAPWGSEFFRLVRENVEVFAALPPAVHEGALRAYVQGASHRGLDARHTQVLVEPWLGPVGQAAFYRQIAQADQSYTDQVQPLYGSLELPVLVVWGAEDTWIPVDRAHALVDAMPNAQLRLVRDAGHLIQIDAPEALATALHSWLAEHR